MNNYFSTLYETALSKLRDEIGNFQDEDNIWRREDGVSNPAGTLVVHLVGSLNYSIGALLGNTGYVRNRVQEFSLTDVPKEKLITDIEDLIKVVQTTLGNIDQQKLDAIYPLEMFGQNTTAYYLIYFYGHLNYHLGQVNYLRRILEA